MNPQASQELQELCEAAIEGRLSTEQQARLEQLVLGDPEARRFYVEYLHLHGCLHWTAAGTSDSTRPASIPMRPAPAGKRRWLVAASGLLAASLLLGIGVWFTSRPPIATLVSSKGCKWDAGTLPTEEGAKLTAGRLRLAEGLARIVFANGAEVSFEAPAEIELLSPQHCVLHAGRLVAKVPEKAIGFVVDTPNAVLTDLGTEFGVHVKQDQTSDVQVFNGIVDVRHRGTGTKERLQTGRNRRFAAAEASDFDPRDEKTDVPLSLPLPAEHARVVQISTALGRGKDAYVQPLYPSQNMSDILLLVKNTADQKPGQQSDYNRKAYLGFDLAPIAGDKIIDAQLSFTYAPTGMGFAAEVPDATFAVYGLLDQKLDSWDEKTLRWKNAPANRDGGDQLDTDTLVLIGKFEIAQGAPQGARSINGEALVNFLNRDNNALATFILIRETKGSGRADLVHGFANKRHPSLPPPTLKLTVVPR